MSDTTIELGMTTYDTEAANAVITATGGSVDPMATNFSQANSAAVDAVNSRGGIAGRKVVPVEYFYNANSFATASGREQEQQRACAQWTEDNQVFAFVMPTGTEEVILECAERTKTPWITTSAHVPVSQRRFATMSDYWYNPPGFVADRRERAVAHFLLAHGFLDRRSKVALMIEDRPMVREGVERGMKPVLAAAGITPPDEIVYPDIVQSPWSTYVLRLQSAGITHVIWSSVSSPFPSVLLMMRAAEDQRYRPHWGVGSDNGPGSLPRFSAPSEQMANTIGVGWQPQRDMESISEQSSTSRVCNEAMNRYGQPPSQHGHAQCEFLFFLKAAFEKATVVSPAGLAEGVSRLGDSYPSAMTIAGATRFAPGRHDGVTRVRMVAFDPSANQFRYTTAPETVPN